MSVVKCRQALEVGLFAMTPALPSAFENQSYTPTTDQAFQRVTLIPALPDNSTIGGDYHQERGMLYIELNYPKLNGSAAAATRAELIRTTFKRGASFTNGGVTVVVETTPEIGQGYATDQFWVLPVRIRYYADIFA